jgi:pyridoxal phosphate enzyme (YggS family)
LAADAGVGSAGGESTDAATTDPALLAGRLRVAHERLATAAARAHRPADDIRLVAVSKTFSADRVHAVAGAGQRAFGENKVQEGLDKIEALRDLGLEWHLIGHLQSNKARKAAAAFAWIETVDRPSLVSKLDAAATEFRTRPHVLIQVDLALEPTKFGARRDLVRDLAQAVLDARSLDLQGLMIVPPFPDDPEESRPWFRQLRELRDELVGQGLPADNLRQLSMGMSRDFEVAIEEGATIVRVGTAIFGRRTPPATP